MATAAEAAGDSTASLRNEAQYYLTLSVMIYLYSKARSLSATGFTSFSFESIALEKSDNHGSPGRTVGEIIMNALSELRRADGNNKEEGFFHELNSIKKDDESRSDNTLLQSLEFLLERSLKQPGRNVEMCPLGGKPIKETYAIHQHAGSCDQCLCYRYGMHYTQVLVDHLLMSEEEKEKQEEEDIKKRPPRQNKLKETYNQHFDHSIPPTTKEDSLQNERLNQEIEEKKTRSSSHKWLTSQLDPESPLGNLLSNNAEIVIVSDKYPEIECVYAISSNKSKKLVNVTFRGTVNLSNWIMNMRARLIDRPNPVQSEYPDREDTIEIHTGFSEYLLRKRLDNGQTKFDEIVSSVLDVAEKQLGGNCRVHVTGHSLGGALATIFALYASADPRLATNDRPIKLFTFAAPYTGGTSFAKAFFQQERAGLLYHARFYHEYDAIPRLARNFSTGWHKSGTEYLHTGLTVKLNQNVKKPPTLFYLTDFSFFSLLRQRLSDFVVHLAWFRLGKAATSHALWNYNESFVSACRSIDTSMGTTTTPAKVLADMNTKSLEELYKIYCRNEVQK